MDNETEETRSSQPHERHIGVVAERISKQRVAFCKGLAAVYGGSGDTEYYLRYILFCLGLKTSGTKSELISRIESHGIKAGDVIHDPRALGDMITSDGLDSCPMYLLKVYLREHGLSTSGNKNDLVERARQRLGPNGKIFEPNPEDKRVVTEAIRAIDRGNIPNEEAIRAMEVHGYLYDPMYNTFFNLATREKILGKKSLLESIWFMTYPSLSEGVMELIPTG